jgi:hypothetical protein
VTERSCARRSCELATALSPQQRSGVAFSKPFANRSAKRGCPPRGPPRTASGISGALGMVQVRHPDLASAGCADRLGRRR